MLMGLINGKNSFGCMEIGEELNLLNGGNFDVILVGRLGWVIGRVMAIVMKVFK
jgi:hypothetical protein